MLRIHFGPDDLARTRLASQPRPLAEIMASLRLLQHGGGAYGFGGWRRRVLRELADERVRPTVAPLFHLVDAHTYSPDFLVPLDGEASVDAELDTVLSTPQARLHRELTQLAQARGRQPAWLRTLADTGGDSLDRLSSALRCYHDVALAPYWPRLVSHVSADRSRSARAMATDGVAAMLDHLDPAISWRPPVLEVSCPFKYDLVLRGGGLLVVPTFFRGSLPLFIDDPELETVLFAQVEAVETTWLAPAVNGADQGPGSADALIALLGATRAAVLEVVADMPTSTGVSRRLGLAPATVSWHLSALRAAGLITTRRNRYAVHALTPLGTALLDGGSAQRARVRAGSNSLPA